MRVPEVNFWGIGINKNIWQLFKLPQRRSQRADSPFFSAGLFFVLFCFILFVCFFYFHCPIFFLPATKFGLLVFLHFMIRSLHLRIKSEISKCFLTSAADNDNDKLRNVLQL